eukprot:superscaffoldBa00000957_g8203
MSTVTSADIALSFVLATVSMGHHVAMERKTTLRFRLFSPPHICREPEKALYQNNFYLFKVIALVTDDAPDDKPQDTFTMNP